MGGPGSGRKKGSTNSKSSAKQLKKDAFKTKKQSSKAIKTLTRMKG